MAIECDDKLALLVLKSGATHNYFEKSRKGHSPTDRTQSSHPVLDPPSRRTRCWDRQQAGGEGHADENFLRAHVSPTRDCGQNPSISDPLVSTSYSCTP